MEQIINFEMENSLDGTTLSVLKKTKAMYFEMLGVRALRRLYT